MQTLEQLCQSFNQAAQALKDKLTLSNIQNCKQILKSLVQIAVNELKITEKYTRTSTMGKRKLLLSLDVVDENVIHTVDKFLSENKTVEKLGSMHQLKGLYIDLEV